MTNKFTLKELEDKFHQIKSKDWNLSSRSGPTGVGKTFEDLLDKKIIVLKLILGNTKLKHI